MRVLQIANALRGGGMEHYVDRSTRDLRVRGCEVVVVSAQDPAPITFEYEVVHVPGVDGGGDHQATRRVLDLCATLRPDVVVSHHVGNRPLLEQIAEQHRSIQMLHGYLCRGGKLFRRGDRQCTHPLGRRCLVDWYTGPCGDSPRPSAALASYRNGLDHLAALRALDAVAVPSRFLRDYLVGEGLSPDRVHVIDNSTGIGPQQPVRRHHPDPVEVVFIGRLTHAKGPQHALRALARLEARFRLTIVGDGWHRSELEALASTLGVGDRVTFTGWLDGAALEAVWGRAAMMVVTSLWPDPAPLTVPEARSHGLPVVTYASGGLAEWAERLDDVTVVPRGDVAQLALALEAVAGGTTVAATGQGGLPDLWSLISEVAAVPERRTA
jgi:glycosyltransferase involved in cell wall biosynthesis